MTAPLASGLAIQLIANLMGRLGLHGGWSSGIELIASRRLEAAVARFSAYRLRVSGWGKAWPSELALFGFVFQSQKTCE
jgi:hypothetical protein